MKRKFMKRFTAIALAGLVAVSTALPSNAFAGVVSGSGQVAALGDAVAVSTETDLRNAVTGASTDAANPTVITLSNSITLSSVLTIASGTYVTIQGATSGITLTTSAVSTTNSSVITVSGTLVLKDVTVDANQLGRVLYIAATGNVTMDDAVAQNGLISTETINTSYIYASGVYNLGTLTMINGSSIKNNTVSQSSNLMVYGGGAYSMGTVTLNSGSSIKNNTVTLSYASAAAGVGIMNDGGTLTIDGGASIDGNTSNTISASTSALGVGVYNSGTCNLKDGSISGNRNNIQTSGSANSAGVYNITGTFNMSGGTISNNSISPGATVYGAGIYKNSGVLNLTGGTISGNTLRGTIGWTRGAGVYVGGTTTSSKLNIGGSIVIKNNSANGQDSDLYLANSSTAAAWINVTSALTGGASSIGVVLKTEANGYAGIVGSSYTLTESDLAAFSYENTGAYLFALSTATNKIITSSTTYPGGTVSVSNESELRNALFYASTDSSSVTNILLENDITVYDPLILAAGRYATITSDPASGKVYEVKADGEFKTNTLNVYGSLALSDVTCNANKLSCCAGYVYTNGKLVINDGTTLEGAYGSANSTYGLGIQTGASVTMNGGLITGNSNDYISAIGVGVYDAGTFTMHGGTISGNTGTGIRSYGGGVYITGSTAAMTFDGGTISGNTAAKGGGIYNNAGTLTISGTASVDGNTANNGGGVYLASSATAAATATMNGGSITNNKSVINNNIATAGNGGGVFVFSGTFTLNDGTIRNNTVDVTGIADDAYKAYKGFGGGIFIAGKSLSGSTVLTGTLNLNGGSVKNNTAPTGGGIYAANCSTTDSTDGTTTTVRYGASAFNVSGVPDVSGNTDKQIMLAGAKLLTTATITGAIEPVIMNVTGALSKTADDSSVTYADLDVSKECLNYDTTDGSGNPVSVLDNTIAKASGTYAALTDADMASIELQDAAAGTLYHKVITNTTTNDVITASQMTAVSVTPNVTVGSWSYTGDKATPDVTVTTDAGTLVKGTDYNVSYSDTSAGDGTVTVTGIGAYSGTLTQTFTVAAKDLSDLDVETLSDETYTGEDITPVPVIKNGDHVLQEGTDFTLSYSDNKNAGTATVTVEGIGNYTGSLTLHFAINTKSVDGLSTDAIDSATYTGSDIKPVPVIKDGDYTLQEGTDFTLSYSDNKNVGTATVTVECIGNYTGSLMLHFAINAKAADGLTIADIPSVTYSGISQTPVPVVTDGNTTLVAETDYTVEYADNVNAGTASVTIHGIGNYAGTQTAHFTINGISLGTASISGISDKAYTGKAQTPSVTVKIGSKTLTKNTDYTVAYSNNTKTGKVTVTVTGTGNYSGSKKVYFNIVPKKEAIVSVTAVKTKKLTVKWTKDSLASGYQIHYSRSKTFASGNVTSTVSNNAAYSKTLTGLKLGKTYYIQVRAYKVIDGKKAYGSWSSVKYKKVSK